jgi:hypothetical protein
MSPTPSNLNWILLNACAAVYNVAPNTCIYEVGSGVHQQQLPGRAEPFRRATDAGRGVGIGQGSLQRGLFVLRCGSYPGPRRSIQHRSRHGASYHGRRERLGHTRCPPGEPHCDGQHLRKRGPMVFGTCTANVMKAHISGA